MKPSIPIQAVSEKFEAEGFTCGIPLLVKSRACAVAHRQVSANSHSLVNKVRSVVVTLLDSSRNDSDLSGLETSTEQYEGVLMSFLTLLTQIENVSGRYQTRGIEADSISFVPLYLWRCDIV
jgi:hypothetical protein